MNSKGVGTLASLRGAWDHVMTVTLVNTDCPYCFKEKT